jgi:predicted nucleic acid-binding protein
VLVVSDTTAITSLLKIGRIDILSMLFSEVVISRAVHEELLRYHPSIPAFLQIRSVKDPEFLATLLRDLDAGEAESIALAVVSVLRRCSSTSEGVGGSPNDMASAASGLPA